MPVKGYIAGRPVSRWEAESDNIDIDYRNLDGHGLGPCGCIEECLTGRKGCALKILFMVVLFFVGLIVGYIIRRNVHEQFIAPKKCLLKPPDPGELQDYSKEVSKAIKSRLSHSPNYEGFLKDVSQNINLAGMPLTNRGLDFTKTWLETFQFDSVRLKKYEVTLSYPDLTVPTLNYVSIEENGTELFHSHTNVTSDHREYLPFSAYSPSATVTGALIYGNYGCKKDFEMLESKGVSVNNSIVILRYGLIHPGSKVKHAQDRGALGVILYSDPYEFANRLPSASPGSWWLPGWAVQSAHVRAVLSGDPRTPDYSSLDGLHRISDYEASYPQIPVQPISYDDAAELLRDLSGQVISEDWKGSLLVDYKSGPGFEGDKENRMVTLSVINRRERRSIHNLIAVIRGKYEKDKYVIVGAHHDSWTRGTVDAGTGYAVLIELAKSFTHQRSTGWRPRRTIIFAFWDASKYGQIGAYEWVQENAKQLGSGAVAYINLDALIRGNYSFYAESSPMLVKLIRESAMTVPCADLDHPNMTVHEMWTRNFPDPDMDRSNPQPEVPSLGGDSDYAPFLYLLGIPSMSPAYTYNLNAFGTLPTYPAYSTLDDTYEYIHTFIDPELQLHATVAKVIADAVLRLADSMLLPLDVDSYSALLDEGWGNLLDHKESFNDKDISLHYLKNATDEFKMAAKAFSSNFASLDKSHASEFDMHLLNDQVLRVTRAFILDQGLPGTPHYRHVLMSPHPENLSRQVIYPGLMGALIQSQRSGDWDEVKEQLAILVTALRAATDIMNNSLVS